MWAQIGKGDLASEILPFWIFFWPIGAGSELTLSEPKPNLPGLLMTYEDFDRYVRRWYNPDEKPRSVSFSLRYCVNIYFTNQ